MTTSPILEAQRGALKARVTKRLESGFVVDAEFAVPQGITVLFGPSGSGKTTILRMIAGIVPPDRGAIALGVRPFFDSEASVDIPARQRHVGYVFQDLALFPHYSALQNVEFGIDALPAAKRREVAMELLSRFRVADRASHRPSELSGGERQRVALARALATRPEVLLLDEPLSALDSAIKSGIIEDLVRWVQENPIPTLYVTHDRDEIYAAAERVIVLEAGKIAHEGAPRNVLAAARAFRSTSSVEYENVLAARVVSSDESAATISCDVGGGTIIECPMPHGEVPRELRIAISAGDILVSVARPEGISARNQLLGTVSQLSPIGHSVAVTISFGSASLISHLTHAAVESLRLETGKKVWAIFKTHSCRILL